VFYSLLKKLVGIFFNILNVLLAGNLPPFGCVCVIVEDQGRYLVIERPGGGYALPGGFMRWHEHPTQTALRESKEETGLQLRVNRFISCSSTVSDHFMLMSTLTVIYQAEVVGGELKSSIEGRPCWHDRTHLPYLLQQRQRELFEEFLKYQRSEIASDTAIKDPEDREESRS
jgi:ADP-ribose pyrophosphatase YjhB (NUDIX family)